MINNNHNYSKDNTVNKQTAISSNNFFEEIEDSEFNLDDKTISDFDNKQNLFQSKINDQTYSNKLNLTYKKDEQLNSDRYENINNYNNEGAENQTSNEKTNDETILNSDLEHLEETNDLDLKDKVKEFHKKLKDRKKSSTNNLNENQE